LDLSPLGERLGRQSAQILDATTAAAAAVYPQGESRRYLLAAQGRYPKGRANFSFTLSRDWKKAVSQKGKKYWRSKRQGISVFIDASSALVSDGDPYSLRGGVLAPQGYAELRQGAVIAGWLENAGPLINGVLASMEIPIQIPADQILFGIYPSQALTYGGTLRLETPSASQARALVTMISMMRLFADQAGAPELEGAPGLVMELLLANPPVQDGSSLIITTNPMTAERIALLFTMFSVYFT
jgi:hypothetical protein